MLSRNNDLEAKVAALTAEKEHLEQQRVREMRELALEQTQETAERKMQENLHRVEIGNVRKGLDKAKKETETAMATSTTLRAKIAQIQVQYSTLQAQIEGVNVAGPLEAKGGGKVNLRPFAGRVPQS